MNEPLCCFDSHAHYDHPRFDSDRDALLAALPANGVGRVLNAASDIPSSEAALALADRYPFVWASAGVHPQNAATLDVAALLRIEQLTRHERVRAIGEIGLDYHYSDGPPRAVQLAAFERQLQLAHELSVPVIIHSREAAQDTFDLVRRYRPRGVVHCFSGSAELARQYVALGMYLGFTGVVTFPNAKKPLEAVAAAPLARLLLETDCPYMAPAPYRGKRCDSTMLPGTVAAMAAAQGCTPQQLAAATWKNACNCFEIAP